ncbi:MAG: sensor histidine kinase, partial [Miltoncostaeaceae bacterium]
TLERAVANLVINGLRFTPAGGRVDVSVAARGGRALVEVADNGLDIAPEDLDDLFSPDRDGPVSSRASLGAGFGLAVVKAVVDAHGGTVTVASDGDGVTFTVSLPLADVAAGASRTVAPLPL